MSKHSIMKNFDSETLMLTADGFEENFSRKKNKPQVLKFWAMLFGAFVLVCSGLVLTNLKVADTENGNLISAIPSPMAAMATKKDVITIPSGVVKANPFVPYRKLGNEFQATPELVNDVPKFDLIAPPEELATNSAAAKIMETVVSGILYDKYSPSAILSIDGTDYLVKKGDTISKYKILSIAKDSVTVKYGNNTYTAGIGELLTDGSVNYNDVSNLSKKFGGEKR